MKQLILLIGDPVSHSVSPEMQNAAFTALKIDYFYSKQNVKTDELKLFFDQLDREKVKGLNITVPHKEAVLSYLDSVSDEARQIGAVNTIKIENGKLLGFNTDGIGYLRSLEEEKKFFPSKKQITILGAGGAARSILDIFCRKNAKKITLFNRTFERTQKLKQDFDQNFEEVDIEVQEWSTKNFEKVFKNTDLLVQTTSASLTDSKSLKDLPLDHLPESAIVSDIVYRPEWTPLLMTAQKRGLETHSGIGMLLYQGAFAFEIWREEKAPIEVMKKALKKAIDQSV